MRKHFKRHVKTSKGERLVMWTSTRSIIAAGALAAIAGAFFIWQAGAAETVPISKVSHIHGIAVDAKDSSRLYLATHYGVFLTSPDGTATRISEDRSDYMGFTPHPTEPRTFYASGHPPRGGNLGFIASTDGGRSWTQRSKGINGPVDFHAMDVSPADPKVVYGLYGGIQVSRDGGKTWEMAGSPPADVFDLAASAKDPNTLYAATRNGLKVSRDAGKSWEPASTMTQPASMVEVGSDGTAYAFIVGTGLVKTAEPSLDWTVLSSGFGERVLLHFAVDPSNPERLFAVAAEGEIFLSTDGGKSWQLHAA